MTEQTAKPIHPDTEPETDELVAEFLKRIVEADAELGVSFRAVTVALPVNDPPAVVEPLTVPSVTFQAEGDTVVAEAPEGYVEAKDDRVWSRDLDGDVLTGRYAESECKDHGTESGVVIGINDSGFFVFDNPKAIAEFAEWLISRAAKMLKAGESK